MSDIVHDRQKAQEKMQKSDAVLNAFSKIVSRKPGYKSIIEKKEVLIKCKRCGSIVDNSQKFCHECETRVEKN